jgi:hypothetical protein
MGSVPEIHPGYYSIAPCVITLGVPKSCNFRGAIGCGVLTGSVYGTDHTGTYPSEACPQGVDFENPMFERSEEHTFTRPAALSPDLPL